MKRFTIWMQGLEIILLCANLIVEVWRLVR